MNYRRATVEELPAVMNVLDGADLAVTSETVSRRLRGGTVLVGVTESDTVVGVLVALPRPAGAHIEAIAVRPGRRGQGIGTALVAEAADRWARLTAAFDPSKRDFYRQIGFEVRPNGERCFGERV